MRLLNEGRHRLHRLLTSSASKLDRKFFQAFLSKKIPSLPQLAHLGLFLQSWEKKVIAVASLVALVALGGIFWQVRNFLTAPAPTIGGDFKEVMLGEPRYINPLLAVSDTDRALTRLVFLPLCDWENKAPAVAANCEINPAGTEVKIVLADRQWHDGTPVTLTDVVFSLTATGLPAVNSPWQGVAARLKLKQIDANTLVVSAKNTPQLRNFLTQGILPQKLWQKIDQAAFVTAALNLKPIGNGPFKYDHATTDNGGWVQSIILVADENFKPRRAFLDSVQVRFAEITDNAKDFFRSRQVDAIFWYDPQDNAELVKRDVQRYPLTPAVVVGLFFNPLHNTTFRNLELRQAVAMAVDRPAIARQAFAGEATPTRAPLPVSVLNPPSSLQPSFDPAGAQKLFKKNLTSTTTWELAVPQSSAYRAATEQIANALQTYGVTINIVALDDPLTPAELLNYDLILLGQDYGAEGNAFPFWHSSQSGIGGANFSHLRDGAVDDLVSALQTDTDAAHRQKVLRDLNNKIVQDLPAIFILQPTYQYFVDKNVRGIPALTTTDAANRFANITDWYINTSKAWR